MQMLRLLAADSANVIVIISGATAAKLCAAFASLLQHNNVWLAAENGTFMRPPPALWEAFSVAEGSEWVTLYENLNFSWVKSVEQVRTHAVHVCANGCVVEAAAVKTDAALPGGRCRGMHEIPHPCVRVSV